MVQVKQRHNKTALNKRVGESNGDTRSQSFRLPLIVAGFLFGLALKMRSEEKNIFNAMTP
jgi:hypothetical protein